MYADLSTIGLVWPEFILILIATWLYVGGTFSPGRTQWTLLATMTYLVAFLVVVNNERALWLKVADGFAALNGPLIIDYLGQLGRYGCLLLGLLLTLMASRAGPRELATEVLGTIMMLVAGLMLVCRANDLVFLFVSLELISIPTYILLFLGRKDRATAEATAKYFFLSILASAMLLYGMSFLYGVSQGTTVIVGGGSVPGISGTMQQLPAEKMSLYLIGLVLIVGGLGFKITAVPFHFYAPDVYQGTTNINAGLLSVAPKIAGVMALVRLVGASLPSSSSTGWQLMLVLAMMTMTLGNVCALWQKNIRRLMAFSSIAHAGYMLIGFAVSLAVASSGGVGAMLLYLFVYVAATLGVFSALAYLSNDAHEVSDVSELAGVGRSRSWAAGFLAICLFSLAGIPPLAGFWGKLALFTGAVRVALSGDGGFAMWFLILAIVGVLNAAIAAAYYLRIISTMYFAPPVVAPVAGGGAGTMAAMIACSLLVVAIGLLPGAAMNGAELSDPLLHRARAVADQPGDHAGGEMTVDPIERVELLGQSGG